MTNAHDDRLDGARNKGNLLMVALGVVGLLACVLLVVSIVGRLGATSQRSESYKQVPGGAGLSATIDYTCKGACKQKYNFNVYVFKEDGQQIAIVRPDKDGRVNAALPEGNYILIIGKLFGNDKIFPEEQVSLKNGKQLELKLHYGEVAS